MNLDQVRAANAFASLKPVSKDGDLAEKVLGLARNFPVLLRTNGLLAGCAYLLAKGKREHDKVADALLTHFRHGEIGFVTDRPKFPPWDHLKIPLLPLETEV